MFKNQRHIKLRSPEASALASAGARSGKILVLCAVLLPAILAIVGLVVDSGMLYLERRVLRNAADAAASAAALEAMQGGDAETITTIAQNAADRALADSDVLVQVRLMSDSFARESQSVEVELTKSLRTHLVHIAGSRQTTSVRSSAVAGHQATTEGAAIVILNEDPDRRSWEWHADFLVVGFRPTRVEGALLVNSKHGGFDEHGDPVGPNSGPPYAAACYYSRFCASDIRVAGGVNHPDRFECTNIHDRTLAANRLPVPDPLEDLPPPGLHVDRENVIGKERGELEATDLERRRLEPGVYEWIRIDGGLVDFDPGVYIVRDVNPRTGLALDIRSGQVNAEGVMFFITNQIDYSPNGSRRRQDRSTTRASGYQTGVYIRVRDSIRLTALADGDSPYDGILLYQDRLDHRRIWIDERSHRRSSRIAGAVYAPSAHCRLYGRSRLNMRFVTRSMMIYNLGELTIAPEDLFDPARDVFLVE